ncbi:uncharacterized protein [Parasteatoda tepidariorum]|uniref:uncharacterized protein isoform X2 n=1 Tax=Parasteatoda tepidariorum TaxID=114398 RepID=UPI001C727689|nr:uncharacterized protein LOC107453245 [Parasteatoda tepidariorum]XP_042901901.1 uncharacterized protein LOC107453245 [Parasteatoda tepidariorum]XP_042901902.1 uncharacterized protein LOC107453245 [Parasteatoda tepidariorum]XP_042901903.1 uncharacterized protein LOC107453245 [Parasteatoda tepidariorum]
MRHLVTCFILGACWLLVQSSIVEDKIFIFQKSDAENNKKVLVVTWPYEDDDNEDAMGCEVFTNPQLIEEVIKASKGELIRTPSEDDLQEIIKECTEISRRRRRETGSLVKRFVAWKRNRNSRKIESERGRDKNRNPNNSSENSTESDNSEDIQHSLPVIFPGTKWCGSGDLAKSYDDLGIHRDTDLCCRAHDVCNDTMAPGETKNNLTNDSPFTKLSCQCDYDFYDCLEKVNSMTSNTVGNMYFNLLKRDCYAEDYPVTKKCKKYKT